MVYTPDEQKLLHKRMLIRFLIKLAQRRFSDWLDELPPRFRFWEPVSFRYGRR
jgi:hypothetical protein